MELEKGEGQNGKLVTGRISDGDVWTRGVESLVWNVGLYYYMRLYIYTP